MLTLAEAVGGKPRRDDGGRAAAILARARALDPHLVEAIDSPENRHLDGTVKLLSVARQLDRTVFEVKKDLATLKAMVEV